MSFILLGILNSQAAGAGAAGSYDLLETTVLTSSASSVSFTGLGSYTDYKHLQIRSLMRSTGVSGAGVADVIINFNSDSSTSYARHDLEANGSSVSSQASSSQTSLTYGQTVPRQDEGAGIFSAQVYDILDFSSTSKNTTLRMLAGVPSTNGNFVQLYSGLYYKTDAITSTTITSQIGSFEVGSRFSLYGIK